MVLTVVLTPLLQKAEKNVDFTKRLEAAKGNIILKNSVSIRSIPFKCIFVRLEKALMRGKNEHEIPLALYICLEYSIKGVRGAQCHLLSEFDLTTNILKTVI